jgi:hypothetical protein
VQSNLVKTLKAEIKMLEKNLAVLHKALTLFSDKAPKDDTEEEEKKPQGKIRAKGTKGTTGRKFNSLFASESALEKWAKKNEATVDEVAEA